MARRTPQQARQTRETLLKTALSQYAEQGVCQTNLKRIAAQAGVTHGALYWHFKNRDDLIIALATQYHLPFERIGMEYLQAIDQDALHALTGFLVDSLYGIVRDPTYAQVYRLFYQRRAELPASTLLDELLQADQQCAIDYIGRFLKQARKQKQLAKKTRHQPLAQTVLAQSLGLINQQPLSGTLITPGIDNLIRGLRATR